MDSINDSFIRRFVFLEVGSAANPGAWFWIFLKKGAGFSVGGYIRIIKYGPYNNLGAAQGAKITIIAGKAMLDKSIPFSFSSFSHAMPVWN